MYTQFSTCEDKGNKRNPQLQVIPLHKTGCPCEQFNRGNEGKQEDRLFIRAWRQNVVSREANWIAEAHWLVLDAGRDSVSG